MTTKPRFHRPDPLSVMLRPRCSECGYEHIRWVQLRHLRPLVDVDKRPRVDELLGWTDPDSDAWWCPLCGGLGAFGPTVLDLD